MCIFLVKKLSGGVKNRKNRHAGGPNAKMPNLFFHALRDERTRNRQKLLRIEKKYNALLKRGILLTHRNFPEKPRWVNKIPLFKRALYFFSILSSFCLFLVRSSLSA